MAMARATGSDPETNRRVVGQEFRNPESAFRPLVDFCVLNDNLIK
jgi:hypothetical protein